MRIRMTPWKSPIITAAVTASVLLVCACGKDKPDAPPEPAYVITLLYNSYNSFFCIHLKVGGMALERCSLGDVAGTEFGGDHEWRLYGIDRSVQPELLILLATGTVTIDRNLTCVVRGIDVDWY